jgi:hypothetical protein
MNPAARGPWTGHRAGAEVEEAFVKSQQNRWDRPHLRWGVLAAALAFSWVQAASAQPWRYEDRKGVHYTSNPHDLPVAQRKQVLAELDARRKARAEAAAKAAEDAALNPPSIASSGPIGVPPPVPRPVVLENATTTPQAAASTPPTPREVWQNDVKAAEAAAQTAKADAEAAEAAAQKASQRALITPSGQHFAAYEEAKKAADEKAAAVQAAQDAAQKLKSDPPR